MTAALFAALNADATLAAMLGTYDAPGSDSGPRPAIFAGDPIPEDAPDPFIVLSGEISQEALLDDNESTGREVLYDIRCYTDSTPYNPNGALVSEVESIAERVRALLHRQTLSVTGFTHVVTTVSGPIVADEVDLFGRVLSVRCLLDGG